MWTKHFTHSLTACPKGAISALTCQSVIHVEAIALDVFKRQTPVHKHPEGKDRSLFLLLWWVGQLYLSHSYWFAFIHSNLHCIRVIIKPTTSVLLLPCYISRSGTRYTTKMSLSVCIQTCAVLIAWSHVSSQHSLGLFLSGPSHMTSVQLVWGNCRVKDVKT